MTDEMKFSNPPPCACFKLIPAEKMEQIDLAVQAIQPAIEQAMTESGACSVALHYLLGAVIAYAAGRALKFGLRDPDRIDVPILNEDEQEALDGLIELSVINARERIGQLNEYYKARANAHN